MRQLLKVDMVHRLTGLMEEEGVDDSIIWVNTYQLKRMGYFEIQEVYIQKMKTVKKLTKKEMVYIMVNERINPMYLGIKADEERTELESYLMKKTAKELYSDFVEISNGNVARIYN